MVTRTCLIIFTYIVVSITWVFFRAENLDDVVQIFGTLCGTSIQSTNMSLAATEITTALTATLTILFWHIYRRNSSLEYLYTKIRPIFRGILLLSQILIIYLFASGDDRAFIYFQF